MRSYNERELSLLFFTTRVIALCWPLQRTQVPHDFTFQTQKLLLIFYLKYFGLAEEKGWMDKRGG